MSVELLILVDSSARTDGLRYEHGLSILIAGGDMRVLFDAAAGAETLLHNAGTMGVRLDAIDAVIVSHGHLDHTGGLAAVASEGWGLNVYAHPGAFNRRWADRRGEPLRDVSCPHTLRELRKAGVIFHPVRSPEKLTDWLVLSGPVGGAAEGEQPFVIRRDDQMVVDGFEDEIFSLVRGEAGWTVVSGCCHRGLKNTLRAAKFLAHNEPITALVGGLHLRESDPAHLRDIADLLERYSSPDLYLCHCTGDEAAQFLRERFGEKVHTLSAGSRVVL